MEQWKAQYINSFQATQFHETVKCTVWGKCFPGRAKWVGLLVPATNAMDSQPLLHSVFFFHERNI